MPGAMRTLRSNTWLRSHGAWVSHNKEMVLQPKTALRKCNYTLLHTPEVAQHEWPRHGSPQHHPLLTPLPQQERHQEGGQECPLRHLEKVSTLGKRHHAGTLNLALDTLKEWKVLIMVLQMLWVSLAALHLDHRGHGPTGEHDHDMKVVLEVACGLGRCSA